MKSFPCSLLWLSLVLVACGSEEPDNAETARSGTGAASRPIDGPECMAGLPSPTNPEQAATEAAARGDVRIFRYEKALPAAAGIVVAGYESCDGRGLAVRGGPPESFTEERERADTLELGEIRDRSHPDDHCADCDFPLSACGERRLAYAVRYNRRIFELGVRGAQPRCPLPTPRGGTN
jgi:hypothetical protein